MYNKRRQTYGNIIYNLVTNSEKWNVLILYTAEIYKSQLKYNITFQTQLHNNIYHTQCTEIKLKVVLIHD